MTQLVLLLCLMTALAAPARAERPAPTKALTVACLYHRLIRQEPDFAAWARKSQQYAQAAPFEREAALEKKTQELQSACNLLTAGEPIIMTIKAQISDYSRLGGGFLVQNFQDMTFFDYEYMRQRYALVPNGITSYQWLKAPASLTEDMMRETRNGHETNMVLRLFPRTADPEPLQINARDYRLVMADISTIEVWSADWKRMIWDGTLNNPGSIRNFLLNLRQ